MGNKRTQKRFISRCLAEFVTNGETIKCISSNFSLDGLFIRTSRPLPVDTELEISLFLANGSISKISGKVARAVPPSKGKFLGVAVKDYLKHGMGIKITRKDANYLNLIRELLYSKGSLMQKAEGGA